MPDVKVDQEEEPVPTNTSGGETILMNNGSRDTSHSDIQKLQQQLQDIKEQVRKAMLKKCIFYIKKDFLKSNQAVVSFVRFCTKMLCATYLLLFAYL